MHVRATALIRYSPSGRYTTWPNHHTYRLWVPRNPQHSVRNKIRCYFISSVMTHPPPLRPAEGLYILQGGVFRNRCVDLASVHFATEHLFLSPIAYAPGAMVQRLDQRPAVGSGDERRRTRRIREKYAGTRDGSRFGDGVFLVVRYIVQTL